MIHFCSLFFTFSLTSHVFSFFIFSGFQLLSLQYLPYTDTRMIWWLWLGFCIVSKNSYTSSCCCDAGSIHHYSKQPWLWFSVVEALFFEQVSLYSNWKSCRSASTPSVMACSNTYINLQTLICCPCCAPQNTQLVL
jgi:hypothetical protein